MAVTVEKGTLVSEDFKSATIIGETTMLVADVMRIEDKKVTYLTGTVQEKATGIGIGSFNYVNGPTNYTMAADPFSAAVTITNELYKQLYIDAVNTLLTGITELEKL